MKGLYMSLDWVSVSHAYHVTHGSFSLKLSKRVVCGVSAITGVVLYSFFQGTSEMLLVESCVITFRQSEKIHAKSPIFRQKWWCRHLLRP